MDKRILIVEDNKDTIKILADILKKNKFLLSISTKGKDVIKILQKEKIDLILLDVKLPDCSGFEICKGIRNFKEFNDIPIIFVTGSTDKDSIVSGFESGGQDYVTKPFISEELIARVNNMLKIRDFTLNLNQIIENQYKDILSQKKELEIKENELTMINYTLEEVLRKIEQDRTKTYESIQENIDKIIMPFINKLTLKIPKEESEILELIKINIKELIGEKGKTFNYLTKSFTSREMEIANMVRAGMSSKDISTNLNISFESVRFHRKNIREKLGIKDEKINLFVFLNNYFSAQQIK